MESIAVVPHGYVIQDDRSKHKEIITEKAKLFRIYGGNTEHNCSVINRQGNFPSKNK
jgi:hypothetical protein